MLFRPGLSVLSVTPHPPFGRRQESNLLYLLQMVTDRIRPAHHFFTPYLADCNALHPASQTHYGRVGFRS